MIKLSNWPYKLPKKDFQNLQNTLRQRAGSYPLNLSLYFDKYIVWKDKDGEEEAKLTNQKLFTNFETSLNSRPPFRGVVPNWAIPKSEYDNYLRRFDSLKKTLEIQKYFCRDFCAKLLWRLVVDIGAESVYETSINLHRNYSVPIIPGSAVKGCTRAYMIKQNDGKQNEKIKAIFGDQERKGSVIFFDALPNKIPEDLIRLDIANVHYPDYYRTNENEPPGDWMEPNPVTFLSIEKAEYQFSVASKNSDLAEVASMALENAIEKMGIGAKTSAGYGYFETVNA